MFALAGDGLWDEGTKLFTRNGIASGDWFGRSVYLSSDGPSLDMLEVMKRVREVVGRPTSFIG